VVVRKGRFGPYAQWGNTVANLPRGREMGDMTLDEAVALLAEKGKTLAPKGKKGAKKPAAKAKPAVKAEPKAAAAKAKPAAKTAAKKPAAKAKPKAAAKPKAKAKTA
jgi:DNA topoisomerase-1